MSVKMKNAFAFYVLLVPCLHSAFAQIFGPQTQYSELNQRRQLSPTQQGHILSDIQQHQHRFNLQQNVLNTPQQIPSLLQHQQSQFSATLGNNFNLQNLLPNQQILQQQQPFLQNQQILSNPSLLPQQLLLPTNQPLQTQSVLPTIQTNTNPITNVPSRIIQHHTQTLFTPYKQEQQQPSSQINGHQHLFQVTSNPLFNIDQSKPLSPEEKNQRVQELQEKQTIIEKHNQFVEKQYKKALENAQNEHQDFVKEQQEEKKKLYQKIYKPTSHQYRYRQNHARYIYPEEKELFDLAIRKYYEEHPTTPATTTTTTTAPTTEAEESILRTREGRILNNNNKENTEVFLSSQNNLFGKHDSNEKVSFVPTALPSNIKTIESLEDLDKLQSQYRSQQIDKDDLIAQLKLAIGDNPLLESDKNVTSREISLPNGEKVEIIRTTDPKLVPGAQPIEPGSSLESLIQQNFNINGQNAEVIKTSNSERATPKLEISDSSLDSLVQENFKLPNGQNVHVIKTTDPQLIPASTAIEDDASFDELVRKKLNLPDGQKYEIIKTTDPKLIPGSIPIESPSSTIASVVKPPKAILDELTKGVVPAGANFDILKHDSGGLEQVSGFPTNLPDQKKVTFVLLEEQNDGSFKVQGVKGNSDNEKSEVDVDSILKRIKDGEIKLPPPINKDVLEINKEDFESKTKVDRIERTSPATVEISKTTKEFIPSVTVTPNSHPYKEISSTNKPQLQLTSSTTPVNSSFGQKRSATTTRPSTTIETQSFSTINFTSKPYNVRNSSPDLVKQASTISRTSQNAIPINYDIPPTAHIKSTTPSYSSSTFTIFKSEPLTNLPIGSTDNYDLDLTGVLKRNGLFAMAKYLKQSGLDTILNETGPYTLFVPNDKAFRTLLVQLGGPDKAEDKFKDNPRLLSGLLLHHVIPGAFKIKALQDEMTGVSLAGTQLRVNQYNMHDTEWNDVKVTTINGAKVMEDKRDIDIPQGTAHGIDRVMFPLPVGDLVQTLQSDRERRFTSFLRVLFASGLAETFQGTKTFTVFAPTDRAFSALSPEDLSRTVSDKVLARELVLRHILSGVLYTNGMTYYQVKDSLNPNKQITISKSSGKVKINNNPISTQNIPATNGVIHAVDFLL